MGKAKKLRSTSHKKQVPPTGGLSPAQLEVDDAMDYSTLPSDEAELFHGLTNISGAIREQTCVALATMFGDIKDDEQERRMRAKLVKMIDAGLLKKLIPRMVDPLKMVRLYAIGALRNMSVTGGTDICARLTAQNVITPLVKIITTNATPETFATNDLHVVQVLEQAIALLANLCESCDAALVEITQSVLLAPIMQIAACAQAHVTLHVETLKLLLLITDSNDRLSAEIGASAAYQTTLGELISHQQLSLLVRLHAVGIAMNVNVIMATEANVARLLPVVEAALAYDAANVLQLAQSVSSNYELSQTSVLVDEDVDDDTITDVDREAVAAAHVKYAKWRESVQVLSLALELVAELAVGGDDIEDDGEWASDDEDAMEQYAAAQIDADSSKAATAGLLQTPTPATTAVNATHIFAMVVHILQGVVALPHLHDAIAMDFERMRIRVANALNNLLQTTSPDAMSADALPQVFRSLCTLVRNVTTDSQSSSSSSNTNTSTTAMETTIAGTTDQPFAFELSATATNDVEAAATAAMRSALRRAAISKQTIPISTDDASLILSRAVQSASVDTRVNAVGMLACVGARSKDASEIDVIARCLVSALQDGSLEVVAEALNAVFDVFSDEDFDSVFRAVGLLPALEATSVAVKSKLRADRKALDRALVAHVKETQLNLTRFIKYKKKHL